MAAVDVGSELVKQISLVRNPLGAKIPEVMVRIANRNFRFQSGLLGQRQPVVSSKGLSRSSACIDFPLRCLESILRRH